MREILFRGKRMDNGEWVYGYLCDCFDFNGVYHPAIQKFECTPKYEVNPETVGQYTGLTDKNGNKIFEGDIVNYNGTVHEVVFCQINGCAFFGITMPDRGEIWNFDGITHPNKMRIIGNIHDNPELLEVK